MRAFSLLSPAQYALLSPQEKKDYLHRLMLDIRQHLHAFRADDRRRVDWLRRKEQP